VSHTFTFWKEFGTIRTRSPTDFAPLVYIILIIGHGVSLSP
jgi:hypothetical protein